MAIHEHPRADPRSWSQTTTANRSTSLYAGVVVVPSKGPIGAPDGEVRDQHGLRRDEADGQRQDPSTHLRLCAAVEQPCQPTRERSRRARCWWSRPVSSEGDRRSRRPGRRRPRAPLDPATGSTAEETEGVSGHPSRFRSVPGGSWLEARSLQAATVRPRLAGARAWKSTLGTSRAQKPAGCGSAPLRTLASRRRASVLHRGGPGPARTLRPSPPPRGGHVLRRQRVRGRRLRGG